MPEGGGAVTGRLSVERLTAVTDRSATGISEDSLAALPTLLPRPWPLPTTLRPWSVLPGARGRRDKSSSTGRVKSSQVHPVAGRARQRSLNGAMQAIRSPKRQVIIRHASVLPHTVCRASLARPRHARSRVRPSQAKPGQVKSRQVCHLQITRGPPWDAPGPCLARTPRRGTRTPASLRTGLPRARTHGRDPR